MFAWQTQRRARSFHFRWAERSQSGRRLPSATAERPRPPSRIVQTFAVSLLVFVYASTTACGLQRSEYTIRADSIADTLTTSPDSVSVRVTGFVANNGCGRQSGPLTQLRVLQVGLPARTPLQSLARRRRHRTRQQALHIELRRHASRDVVCAIDLLCQRSGRRVDR